jgi:hypothetical protein
MQTFFFKEKKGANQGKRKKLTWNFSDQSTKKPHMTTRYCNKDF